MSALLDFLLARAEEDAREACAGSQIDHVLLDGSQVVRTLVRRVRAAVARGEAPPQLHTLQVRALLYADHRDFREEWRPCERGVRVEMLFTSRPHLRRHR
ncbi:hypothetical protein [Nocardioides pacificus]